MRGLIVILFFVSCSAKAQELNYGYVDSATYAQYMAKDYKALQKLGSKALDKQIDFYYLRMRMGISYYEKNKFEKAIPHFKHALEMSPVDTVAKEYLYYSYLFSNRIAEADFLKEKMPKALKKKVGYSQKKLETFSLETGLAVNNNIASHSDALTNTDLTENKQYVYNGGIFYTKAFMQHKISPRFSLQNSLTLYHSQSLTMVKTPKETMPYEYGNTHFQYNFGFSYAFDKGWELSTGFGYYHINFTSIVPHQQQQQHMGPPGPPGPPTFAPENSTGNYFSACMTLSKRFKYVEPFIGMGYTSMYSATQYQGETGFTFYPFGNTHFYLVGQGAYLMNKTKNNYVITGKLGGTIGKTLFYETVAMVGNLNNYLANNGFVTYNSFDIIKLNAGLDFGFRFKKMSLIPSYRFQQKEGQITSANPAIGTKYYSYTNQFFILTLQWKF